MRACRNGLPEEAHVTNELLFIGGTALGLAFGALFYVRGYRISGSRTLAVVLARLLGPVAYVFLLASSPGERRSG